MYSVYVFENDDNKLYMFTCLPNWGVEYNLSIGDKGYVTIQTYVAGEEYYNRYTGNNQVIKFTNVYLKEFVKDNKYKEQIIL